MEKFGWIKGKFGKFDGEGESGKLIFSGPSGMIDLYGMF
jgi:hypothetical protein